MNENIDLTKILKCCPEGTKFWSMLDEEVEFVDIDGDCIVFRVTKTNKETFYYNDGKAYRGIGECVLFPSKEQRDWSKFVPTWIVKVTLHPFDKVLVRDNDESVWFPALYGNIRIMGGKTYYMTVNGHYKQCIPYKGNENLLGETMKCIDYYKTW